MVNQHSSYERWSAASRFKEHQESGFGKVVTKYH